MHNTDQIGMVVKGKQWEMKRTAERERLAGQIPLSRPAIIRVRVYGYLLTLLANRLILSGEQLQKRADYLTELLNNLATEANAPIQKT